MSEFRRTLVTASNGKTGRRITERMEQLGAQVRKAVRRANPELPDEIGFDWYDPATHSAALEGADSVYLVAPLMDMHPAEVMGPFVEKAVKAGVRRFVFLGSASIDADGPVMGEVHKLLINHAPEWTILRPSYFMENFSEGPYRASILQEGRLYSAAGDGRIGFVSADDIAAVAVQALTAAHPLQRELIITGPQAITYGDAARIIGDALGRTVEHVHLTDQEFLEGMIRAGMTEAYANMMLGLEHRIRLEGSEDQTADTVLQVTGEAPVSFERFVQQNAEKWI
ncbi:NAD(P)H-binding protein [Paenibacillus sp. JX-17]|uniref:NAD(P)H-binding protein n=1 Tax=Paenibacillus lacisoli TaxID=3064525 RepID=A0ABT9CAU7_9BACL|nr:NAD(P)H-binding protein [Paenibacillus sp. JX-17]MDO7906379.1 NAD(P)H-binding protein [Paenibacillus sp. JX-17]